MAFRPDGSSLIAWAREKPGRFWDPMTGETVQSLSPLDRHPIELDLKVKFSQRGDTLASCEADGSVGIWDLTAGRQKMTFRPDASPPVSLTLSADGQRLLTCHRSGPIRVWDVATRQ